MAIHHLPFLDHDRWYLLHLNRGEENEPPWRTRLVSLHGPNSEARIEWHLLGGYNFGWGFKIGRNGGESDLGLDLYFGRALKLWTRLRASWTSWARIDKDSGDKNWFYGRHTGLRLHPHEGCLVSWDLEALDGVWSAEDPWWRSGSITRHTILGKRRSQTEKGDSGVARIPLPEGTYLGTWEEKTITTTHVRWPGTWYDRIWPSRHRYVDISVEGGIPVQGKGENSWDCGMDGIFGTGGSTLAEAISNYVKAVLKGREKYGGPHDLTQPMTVEQAEARSR